MQLTTEFNSLDEPYIHVDARNWNDHHIYRTSFDVVLHGEDELRPIGSVKILRRGETHTRLPACFDALPTDYCSLGQSPRYDEEVAQLERETGVNLHAVLRDIRWLGEDERQDFTSEPSFDASLLRFAPARFLYTSALGELSPALRVDLRTPLPGFDAPHELSLDLDPDRLLGRLAVVIGENGTGKTRFLDATARALCGLRADFIAAGSPSVSRVIALSCNAFDEFLIPQTHIPDIYFYVGLRSRQGAINVKEAAAEVESRVRQRLRPEPKRHELWVELMQVIGLNTIVDLEGDELRTAVGQLGAGFKFACYALTRLVSVIEPRSFVLFDEPENHTHPRLLSMMMRALHRVLERFESFALVATHSPLVVQEIPASQVHILRCFEGSYPNFSTPADETFGASLGELLRKTFLVDYNERNFDVLVRELVERHGAPKVRAELGDEMALSARLLLDKLGGLPVEGEEP